MKKTHNKKKIIIFIVYILLIGLCVLVAIKGCTTNITYALDATNWEQLNNVPVRCVIEGPIDNTDLSNNTWSYISNGNSETGPAQAPTPAFYITDIYDGEQYDAIYIKTRDIQLRRFIYDEVSGDMVDYYSRTIWQDDWIYEQIEPHIIKFEGLNNTAMASSAVKYSLAGFGGQEQTGANHNAINSIMLGIINNIFTTAFNEQMFTNLSVQDGPSITVYLLTYNNYLYGANNKIVYHYNDVLYREEFTYFLDTPISFNNYNNAENLNYNYIEYEIYLTDNDVINIYMFFSFFGEDANDLDYYSNIYYYGNDLVFANSYYNFLGQNPDYLKYTEDLAYNDGYLYGYERGQEIGYADGYDDGYTDGYDDGASGEINTTWVLSLMNTATSILNIEILPNIRIIYLVGAFIVLAFVRFVIGWLR